MSRVPLLLARFLLSAWFGAATLFVIIGVREVRYPGFDSPIRDQLVVVRFPVYYACGFTVLGCAAVNLVLLLIQGLRKPPTYAAAILTALALGLMAYDYPCVYGPLARMVTPPGKPRPAEFQTLHEWSKTINAAQLGCVLLAAITLCAVDGRTVRAGIPDSASQKA